jgi:hypothetical protein
VSILSLDENGQLLRRGKLHNPVAPGMDEEDLPVSVHYDAWPWV